MWNSSIWPTDRTLSGAINAGQSRMVAMDAVGTPHSPNLQASPSDGLESYQDNYRWGSYTSTEMQSVYSTDWASKPLSDYFTLLVFSKISIHNEEKTLKPERPSVEKSLPVAVEWNFLNFKGLTRHRWSFSRSRSLTSLSVDTKLLCWYVK